MKSNSANSEDIVSVWRQTIEVQEHFNDIALRVRNLAMTILGAFLVGIAYAIKEEIKLPIFGIDVDAAILLTLGAVVIWDAFEFMDTKWYHPLLLGAVRYGERIESEHSELFGKGLTNTISENSPIEHQGKTLHSKDKAGMFYGRIKVGLYITIGVLILSNMTTSFESRESAIISVREVVSE